MKYFIISCICIVLYIAPKQIHATHIVGGELNYTHLTGDEYEIDLRLFLDCYNGLVSFDDTVSIAVYSAISAQLIEELRIPFDMAVIDTLPPPSSSIDCLIFPPNICTNTSHYKANTQLPPNQEGYFIVFQRCCRNATIGNIYTPDQTGITLMAYISPLASVQKNSNPKFTSWPPNYICADTPINYPHGAYDEDGDSLVYKLCTPLGTTDSLFIFAPPLAPPYEEVSWISPPYSETNMLNAFPGNPALSIDSTNGILTGSPNTIGQFVVGICVEEYRNGALMGYTRRDFQYNVGICIPTTAAFSYPQCVGLEVDFQNNSNSANTFLWNFDLENNPDIESTEVNPSYNYTSSGNYTVRLIAEPYTLCADTSILNIEVKETGMTPEIDIEELNCQEPRLLLFTAIPQVNVAQPIEYLWLFSNGDSSQGDFSLLILEELPDTISVALQILASDACTYYAEEEDIIIEESIQASFIESANPCGQSPVYFTNTSQGGALEYLWTFDLVNEPDSFISSFNAVHLYEEPGNYQVRLIAAPNTTCADTIITEIQIAAPSLYPEIETSILDCADNLSVQLSVLPNAVGNPPISFIWNIPGSSNLFEQTIQLEIPLDIDEYPIQVQVIGEDLCPYIADTLLSGFSIAEIPSDQLFYTCPGDSLYLDMEQEGNYQYQWTPDQNISATDEPEVYIYPDTATSYNLQLSNDFGCSNQTSISVIPLPSPSAEFLYEQVCGSTQVFFFTQNPNISLLQWDFGDGSPIHSYEDDEALSHSFPTFGNYSVRYWYEGQQACEDTLETTIFLEDDEPAINSQWSVLSCEDSLVLGLELNLSSTNVSIDSAIWSWGNGNSAEGEFIQFTTAENFNYSVEVYYDSTCMLLLSGTTDLPMPDLLPSDTILLCQGDSLLISLSDSILFDYSWLGNNNIEPTSGPNLALLPLYSEVFIVQAFYELDSLNCSLSDSLFLELAETPLQEIRLIDGQDCQDSILFTISDPSQSLDYEWFFNQNPLEGSDSLVIYNTEEEGFLYLSSTTDEGCSVLDSIYYEPSLIWDIEDSVLSPCFEDSLIYEININGNYELEWISSAIPISTGQSSYIFPYSIDQTYIYCISDNYSCKDTVVIQIEGQVFDEELSLYASSDSIIAGEELIINSSLIGPYEYEWIYNNFVYSQDLYTITVFPTESTTYYLELTDLNSCQQRAGITITVLDPSCQLPYVYIPNTFTPNDDQNNDCFKVESIFVDQVRMIIYNRWGEKVFESEALGDCWDGRLNNKKLDSDVYVYEIWYQCINGEQNYQKGNITLIR